MAAAFTFRVSLLWLLSHFPATVAKPTQSDYLTVLLSPEA